MRRQIILDTETTGLYAENGDRLVEFAGLEMINRQMTGRFLHLYVHPERDMPEEAARVHGLTIDVLEEKKRSAVCKGRTRNQRIYPWRGIDYSQCEIRRRLLKYGIPPHGSALR